MTNATLPWPFVLMLVSLPLVQVGTVRAPMRLILPDLLALGLGVALLMRWRSYVPALTRDSRVAAGAASAAIFCVTSAAASVISLAWITPLNFQQWAGYENTITWLGTPLQRTLIENLRLVQCVSAFVVTLALADTEARVRTATSWFVIGASAAAAYGLYVWVGMVTESDFPLLPGTFTYLHLKRTAATFPEPAAYGGFALSGIALTLWLIESGNRKGWLYAALATQLFAAITSLSTLLIAGLVVIWIVNFARARRRTVAVMTAAAVATVLLVLAAVPTAVVVRAIQKPLTTHASWLDRVTAWRAASAMTIEYPALGVGVGLYAYNQAPFIPWGMSTRHAGGRVNSPILEVAAESGIVGLIAGAVLCLGAWSGAARGRHGFAGLRGAAVLVVLIAGYYTSRYAFLWVFAGLLIAAGTAREAEGPQCAC